MNKRPAVPGKTVLIFVYGNILAHVCRPLEIAKEMRARGYRVLFAGNGKWLDMVRQAGFQVFPVIELAPGELLKYGRRRLSLVGLFSEQRVERFVQEEIALMQELKPDLIVNDFRWTASISARVLGLPLVGLVSAYGTKYGRPRMTSFPKLIEPLAEPIRLWLVARPISKVRHKYGLPPIRSYRETWSGDLTLMTDIPEYAPLRHQPDNFHYIGPIPWEPNIPLPAWVNHLDNKRPVVYLTGGSTCRPGFLDQAVRCFDDSGYQVIIAAGKRVSPVDLRALSTSGHIYAEAFLPGLKIMDYSDVVVFHAGNGTAYQALSKGVPMVCVPSNPEQQWNANRLVELGVGLKLETPDPVALRGAIDEILTNPRYKANAMRFTTILARNNGAKTAARLIHQYLAQREKGVAPARELAPRIFPMPKRWVMQLASFAAGFVKRGELSAGDKVAIRGNMGHSDE
jgi:MGT family glycosyltransferase